MLIALRPLLHPPLITLRHFVLAGQAHSFPQSMLFAGAHHSGLARLTCSGLVDHAHRSPSGVVRCIQTFSGGRSHRWHTHGSSLPYNVVWPRPHSSFNWRHKDDDDSRLGLGPPNATISSKSSIPPLPLSRSTSRDNREYQAYRRELRTVTVAIAANLVIFAAKLVTYILSGSSAMLAETVHSVVDTFNQLLLRVGILRSAQAPTVLHPYGYMKDKFVWSLVSAVGIFCLGAGVTVAHGIGNLLAPPGHLENLSYGLGVLAVSLAVEGFSLLVATRSVVQGAAAAHLSFMEFVRRGMDPTSIAVMLEDGAAVTGLLIAGASMWAVHVTGNAVYDAAGSITIGVLLGATAVFLIQQNRSLLIGRSMNPADMRLVMDYLRRDPVVKAVYDAKSEEMGPGIYRFKAEIGILPATWDIAAAQACIWELEFHGEQIVERHMERLGGRERVLEQMHAALLTRRDATIELALRSYGTDMVGALGAEVDRLEAECQKLVPGLRHIDLETDRGRHDKYSTGKRGLYSVDWSEIEAAAQQYSPEAANSLPSPARPATS